MASPGNACLSVGNICFEIRDHAGHSVVSSPTDEISVAGRKLDFHPVGMVYRPNPPRNEQTIYLYRIPRHPDSLKFVPIGVIPGKSPQELDFRKLPPIGRDSIARPGMCLLKKNYAKRIQKGTGTGISF